MTVPTAVAVVGHSPTSSPDHGAHRWRVDRDADVAIVGAGYTGLWTAYYLLRGRPDAAGRRARGRDRRVRRQRAQRRLVLGAVPDLVAEGRAQSLRPARLRSRLTARCTRRSTRSARSRRPRASTPTSPRAAPSCSPARRCSCERARSRGRRVARLGLRRGRLRGCSTPPRRPSALGATDMLGGDVHTALRSDPPGPPRPRPGRGRRAPRGVTIYEGPVSPRSARRRCAPRTGTVRAPRRRARDGGLHAPRSPAHRRDDRPGLLADDRDRAAARARSGTRSGSASARRSTTTAT